MIAGKALRRYLCLGIPASTATTISWFMTNVGAFRFSKTMPGNVWLNFHSAWESPTWGMAFRSLWHAIVKKAIFDCRWLIGSCIHGLMMVKSGIQDEILMRGFNGLWL